MWAISFPLLVTDVLKLSKTIQATAVAPGCLPELEGETLLLKTPYTLATGLRKINLVMTRILLPCLLVFLIVGHAMEAAGGEAINSLLYPACEPSEPQ